MQFRYCSDRPIDASNAKHRNRNNKIEMQNSGEQKETDTPIHRYTDIPREHGNTETRKHRNTRPFNQRSPFETEPGRPYKSYNCVDSLKSVLCKTVMGSGIRNVPGSKLSELAFCGHLPCTAGTADMPPRHSKRVRKRGIRIPRYRIIRPGRNQFGGIPLFRSEGDADVDADTDAKFPFAHNLYCPY